MLAEFKASRKCKDKLTEIINTFFEKNECGILQIQPKHPIFTERRFKSSTDYDGNWQEGELREVVEAKIPPTVLQNLIDSGKAKYDGVMVYLPRRKVGNEKAWGKVERGDRNQSLEDQQWVDLEAGINDAMLAVEDTAGSASGHTGSSSSGLGGVAMPKAFAANVKIHGFA